MEKGIINMHVRKRAQGDEQSRLVPFDIKQITKQLIPATDGIPNISVKELEDNISLSVSNGITTAEIQSIAIKIALSLTDLDKPGATYVAARLSLYDLYHKIKHLYLKTKVEGDVYKLVTFNDYIKYGVDNNLLSEFPSKYTEEELTELNNTIVGDRDLLFDFQGVKTFLSRYGLTNKKDEIIELPQYLHMGVATFLAQNEKDPVRWSKEFYNITSKLEFINATPINSNGRRRNGSTISCLVVDTPDTASGILDKIKEVGLGSKKGAGFGWNWSSVRSVGSSIGTKPNAAGGKIPFLKIANDLSTAIDQDGTRPGAFAVYINIYDIDILDFIDMKKKNGDERRRCRDLFPSINYDDVFMNRLDNNETYTLFSPHDVPLLKDTYGDEFREHYLNYEKEFLANPDKFNPNTEVISANKVFSQIALSFHGEGVPFTHFIDNSNRQHKYPELGKIRSSNLCVVGSTTVLTKDYGNVEIGHLVDVLGIEKTLCWNGEEWSMTELFQTSKGQEVTSISFSNGMGVVCTPYHKWAILDDAGKEIEKRTHELEIGDRLINHELPNDVTFGDKRITKPYESGFFTGDGTNIYNKKRELIRKKIYLYSDKEKLLGNFKGYLTKRYALANDGNNKLTTVIYDKDALEDKHFIPDASYSKKDIMLWLAGIFDSDGTVTKDKDGDSASIQLPSVNYGFLTKLLSLLQEIGVSSKVRLSRKAGFNLLPMNDGSGKSKYYPTKELYRLLINRSGINSLLAQGLKTHRLILVSKELKHSKFFRPIIVESVNKLHTQAATYCGTEPKRNKLIFNGVISRQCSEIFQPTSVDRTAVCNLGSINLARVNSDEDLERVVPIAIRMLDNGIDTTFYPSEQSKLAQLERRSLGLGALGEAELMAQRGIVYGSQEHKDLIGHIYAKIEEISERTTRELAIEKGSCIIDGVRNAYIRAVAPNSTSGIFAGTTNSHECVFDIMWMEDNQTGNYPMTAPNLNINNYKYWTNSYDVDQLTLIDLTKIRQKHTDQGISHTVFLYPEELRASRIKEIFVHAWKQGLLSLYYWRSKPPKNTDTSLATKKDNISCFGCTN